LTRFRLVFLAIVSDFMRKGEFWLVRGRLFLAKTLRTFFFVLVSTVILPQLTCCARARKNKNITKKIRRNNLIMVSTRKSPQKTRPTGVPTLSGQARVRAECAEQRAEQRSAAARANAPVEEAHRPIEEEEVSQLDIVDDDDVYQHGNDDDDEECVGSKTMDVDDNDEEEQKVEEEEEEEEQGAGGGVDVLGTVVLKRQSKLALNDTYLCTYLFYRLERMSCPNRSCGCLAIVHDSNAQSAIAKYLTWFERRNKYKQDSIVFEFLAKTMVWI
jgi:hypothetical protein